MSDAKELAEWLRKAAEYVSYSDVDNTHAAADLLEQQAELLDIKSRILQCQLNYWRDLAREINDDRPECFDQVPSLVIVLKWTLRKQAETIRLRETDQS